MFLAESTTPSNAVLYYLLKCVLNISIYILWERNNWERQVHCQLQQTAEVPPKNTQVTPAAVTEALTTTATSTMVTGTSDSQPQVTERPGLGGFCWHSQIAIPESSMSHKAIFGEGWRHWVTRAAFAENTYSIDFSYQSGEFDFLSSRHCLRHFRGPQLHISISSTTVFHGK